MHETDADLFCRSGLRGAVGLALALFVLLDDQIASRSFRVLTFFYMGAQAFLTLVVQGTTMPHLLRVCAHQCHIHTGMPPALSGYVEPFLQWHFTGSLLT